MNDTYVVYEVSHCYYLDKNNNLKEYKEFLPLYEFNNKNEALKKIENMVCECKPYIEESKGYNFIGYTCIEYELVKENISTEESIKYKAITDYDKSLNKEFFEEILKKLKNKKIVFHNWFPNPEASKLISLQKL
ncbi:hypothetical protein EII29_02485 [Leptotrichia sp. OH3620_COT-345]|uniref:hypothetical protein n=1 Tax=Leptotrichia sp. OH3620_COT-345 TaxID=2491048 RepID=UPI000F654E10|nr:hypothetical protein [Leptotrichia sp. OH3620_COT-345]RRD40366.1 hypothetical protein EII29_02485 [Leptotrichia sp. OH3620_COT-345]